MAETHAAQTQAARHAARQTGPRSTADVVTLLIELGRALKARRFYPGEHPARKATLARSFRAWRTDLERSGPLELEVRQGAFRIAGESEALGRGTLDELARELVHHAVRRLRVEPDLDAEAFEALVAVLSLDPDEVQEAGGVERALYARAPVGITLNAVDYAALLERETRGGEADAPSGAAEPDVAEEASARGEAASEAPSLPEPPERQSHDVDPLTQLGELLQGEGDEAHDGTLQPEAEPDRGAELVARLRLLDECREDGTYARALQAVMEEVEHLPPDAAGADDVYRAVLVLSAHAGEGARSERQRTLAEEALFHLATGARLDDVVRRACEKGPQASVRATQILLQLGAHAVPRLLDALLGEDDPERRGQLNALLIAMGDKATPEVKRSLEEGEPPRARLAARLAGELQNPGLAPYLRGVLRNAEAGPELQKEAAKALQRIGGATAARILADAVSAAPSDVAAVAAHALAATRSPRGLEVLVTTMRRALREDDQTLAREMIRALGRLGREEAVPALGEILGRRSLLGRKKLRELKLAAAAALGRLPGDEARSWLERVAQGRGDAQVRRAARTALARRSAS